MTRNRAFYAALALFSLALAFYDASKSTYALLYSIMLLPLASLALSWAALRKLEIVQAVDKDFMLKGEEAKFRVRVKGTGFLYSPGLTLIFPKTSFGLSTSAKSSSFSIFGAEEKEIVFAITCKYRGLYDIGVEAVQASDFLGLFNLERKSKEMMRLTVYPRIAEIENLPLSLNLMSQSYSRHVIREEDYSTFSDVRQYNSADGMKRIHWKLSAKRMELMVKNYETTALNTVSIFLDQGKCGTTPMEECVTGDRMVEVAVASVFYCLKKQMPVALFSQKEGLVPASGMHDFDKIYTMLAHMPFAGESTLSKSLMSFMNDQSSPGNLAVIVSTLDDEAFEVLVSAHNFGHNVILTLISPNAPKPEIKAIFDELLRMGLACVLVEGEGLIENLF
ncbi:MAG: DUF58 domain-containing protein [Clostridiales bacterium]|jgi:uncharacterized protein (DUF58 family)|nr:DUF58 domain-containing protein [Clostridiales bacterium]